MADTKRVSSFLSMESGSTLRNIARKVELEKCDISREMMFLYSELLLLAFYQNHVGLSNDG